MKRAPAELYTTVMNEVTFLINSLDENTDDKEVLEQQEQAKKNLNGVYKELQYSLEHLKKNAEWDVFTIAFYGETNAVSASSRIEQLTPINFEHFRSQTCSGDASYGSWLHSCERPPLDAEYGLG